MYKEHEDRGGGEPEEPHAIVVIGQFFYNHINVTTKCENCRDNLQTFIINYFAQSIAETMLEVIDALKKQNIAVTMEDPRDALQGAIGQISELKEKLDAEASGRSDDTTRH